MAGHSERPQCTSQDFFTHADFQKLQNETWSINLQRFSSAYSDFHQAFSIVLAVFGVLSNLVFIIVLTRPSMVSAVNIVLTSIAACDTGLMLSHFVFLVRQVLTREADCDYKNEGWAKFSLFHANFGLFAHAGSLWLTVAMAFFRWYMVRDVSGLSMAHLSNRNIILSIASTLLFVAAMCIPSILSYTFTSHPHMSANCTVFTVAYSSTSYLNNCLLMEVHFWTGGIGFKMVPCFILAVFMGLLLVALYQARKRRNRLLSAGKKHRNFSQDRTTVMLLLILFIFWITELPQGILTVLGGYLGTWFIQMVYRRLGDVLDDLSLINSCVNFVLYCCMSSQFRSAFKRTFLRTRHYLKVPTTNAGEKKSESSEQASGRRRPPISASRQETCPCSSPAKKSCPDVETEHEDVAMYANGHEVGEHEMIKVETML